MSCACSTSSHRTRNLWFQSVCLPPLPFVGKHFILKNIFFNWLSMNVSQHHHDHCLYSARHKHFFPLYFSGLFSFEFNKARAACTGSHSWEAYWLDTGQLHTRHITAAVARNGETCKLWLYQKTMTCKPPVKSGRRVARTINQSQICGVQKRRSTKVKIDSASARAECQSQGKTAGRGCGWIGAWLWLLGWCRFGVGGCWWRCKDFACVYTSENICADIHA